MNDSPGDKTANAAGVKVAGQGDLKKVVGRTEDVPRGIVMMIVATALFAAASAASKWLVGDYPIGEVLFIRSLSSLMTGAAIVLPVAGLSVYATKRPRDHLLRGMSQSISQLCLLIAFSLMPLAGAVAINFSSPLFAAVVSDLLAERARRLGTRDGADRRLCRRADRDRSWHKFVERRRVVRADQCDYVRQRHHRGARHDANRIRQYAFDLAVVGADVLSQFPAATGMEDADSARCGVDVRHRLHQRDRAVVLDQIAASCAGCSGDAVLLSDAGVVAGDRISLSGATCRRQAC